IGLLLNFTGIFNRPILQSAAGYQPGYQPALHSRSAIAEVVCNLLSHSRDRVFQVCSRTVVVRGENGDDDVAVLALETPEIVADVRQEIAGLMWNAEPSDVFRQSRTVDLAAHHLQHEIARFLADRLTVLQHFEQLSHIARRRKTERRLALSM